MQLVQIDGVHPEPAQGGIQCAVQVAARQAQVVDIGTGDRAPLGGQNDTIGDLAWASSQPAADDLFGETMWPTS